MQRNTLLTAVSCTSDAFLKVFKGGRYEVSLLPGIIMQLNRARCYITGLLAIES